MTTTKWKRTPLEFHFILLWIFILTQKVTTVDAKTRDLSPGGGRYLRPLPPAQPEPIGPIAYCGGTVNGTHGSISTPNFPRRFPVPISCQWLLHAPPGKKIVLFFTQFYMRESFQLTE